MTTEPSIASPHDLDNIQVRLTWRGELLVVSLDRPGPSLRRFDSDGELLGEYDHLGDAMG